MEQRQCFQQAVLEQITNTSEQPKSGTLTSPNAGKAVEQQEFSDAGWWERRTVQPLWKAVCWFLTKLNMFLQHDPAMCSLVVTQRV